MDGKVEKSPKNRGTNIICKSNNDFMKIHTLAKLDDFIDNILSLSETNTVDQNLTMFMNFTYLLFDISKRNLTEENKEILENNVYFRRLARYFSPKVFISASFAEILNVLFDVKYVSKIELDEFAEYFSKEWVSTFAHSENYMDLIQVPTYRCNDTLTEIFDREIYTEIRRKCKKAKRLIFPKIQKIQTQYFIAFVYVSMFFAVNFFFAYMQKFLFNLLLLSMMPVLWATYRLHIYSEFNYVENRVKTGMISLFEEGILDVFGVPYQT